MLQRKPFKKTKQNAFLPWVFFAPQFLTRGTQGFFSQVALRDPLSIQQRSETQATGSIRAGDLGLETMDFFRPNMGLSMDFLHVSGCFFGGKESITNMGGLSRLQKNVRVHCSVYHENICDMFLWLTAYKPHSFQIQQRRMEIDVTCLKMGNFSRTFGMSLSTNLGKKKKTANEHGLRPSPSAFYTCWHSESRVESSL